MFFTFLSPLSLSLCWWFWCRLPVVSAISTRFTSSIATSNQVMSWSGSLTPGKGSTSKSLIVVSPNSPHRRGYIGPRELRITWPRNSSKLAETPLTTRRLLWLSVATLGVFTVSERKCCVQELKFLIYNCFSDIKHPFSCPRCDSSRTVWL